MNWISPTAPLPAAFFTEGEKVSPLSHAMHAIRSSGSTLSLSVLFQMRSRNFGETLAPHAIFRRAWLGDGGAGATAGLGGEGGSGAAPPIAWSIALSIESTSSAVKPRPIIARTASKMG